MKPVTLVYVTDMETSLAFYRRLLPHAEVLSASRHWSELSVGSASVALHLAEEVTAGSQVGFALLADRPLEDVAAALDEAGVALSRGIADETFGRSMVVRDPDGLAIQINEHGT